MFTFFLDYIHQKHLFSNAWVVENLDLPRFKINKNTIKKEWKHLPDLPTGVDNSKEISILIEADFFHLHLSRNVTCSFFNTSRMGVNGRKRER